MGAAACAAMAFGASASAMPTATLDSPVPDAFNGINDFEGDLITELGTPTLYSAVGSITLSGPATITITEFAGESGFDNSFTANGQTISESVQKFSPGAQTESIVYSLIADLTIDGDEWLFDTSGPEGPFNLSLSEFGVFTNGATSGLTRFFIALDDDGAAKDDNHDDYILEVVISEIPVPAAGILFLTALAGAGAARRRKAATA